MSEEAVPVPAATETTLQSLFDAFKDIDPKNTQTIKVDQFNVLSVQFGLSGEWRLDFSVAGDPN